MADIQQILYWFGTLPYLSCRKLGRTLAIQWMKYYMYTVDSMICFINTCPLDKDVHLLNNWGHKVKQTCMLKSIRTHHQKVYRLSLLLQIHGMSHGLS